MQIFVLGLTEFPYSYSAKISRYKALTKALCSQGKQVTVVNNVITPLVRNDKNLTDSGVKVVNTSYLNIKSYTLHKLMRRVIGLFEFITLFKLVNRKEKNVFIVYTSSDAKFLRYYFFAKVLGAKLIYDYVEKVSMFKDTLKNDRKLRRSAYFESQLIYLSDGIFAISEYLLDEVKSSNKKIEVYKLPAMFDYTIVDSIESKNLGNDFFMYCGTVVYIEVVNFIIQSFIKLNNTKDFKLLLVLNGENSQIKALRKDISTKGYTNIDIKSALKYEDLLGYYKGAKALLIPLRNNVRDIARFPQKISEYSAFENIIISTEVGDVKYYFKNGESALLANKYDVHSFSAEMQKVIDNDIDYDHLSKNCYCVGKNNFDSNSQTGVGEFIEGLFY